MGLRVGGKGFRVKGVQEEGGETNSGCDLRILSRELTEKSNSTKVITLGEESHDFQSHCSYPAIYPFLTHTPAGLSRRLR